MVVINLYHPFFKRLFDFFIAFMLLVFLAPILLIISLIVKIKLGSPIIFKQKRPGLNGKVFTMYKFRSMIEANDELGNSLSDMYRITKFGKFLRKTSLDELPELINVIKGDMSIVGPRPQLIQDYLCMSPYEKKRHSVRPGITGLAQVKGRNSITWDEKFVYDLLYLEKITFFRDIKIILKTIINVVLEKDITQENHVTAHNYGEYLIEKRRLSLDEYKSILKKECEIIKGVEQLEE